MSKYSWGWPTDDTPVQDCTTCPLSTGWPDAAWWKEHGHHIADRIKWQANIAAACATVRAANDSGYSSVCRWAIAQAQGGTNHADEAD